MHHPVTQEVLTLCQHPSLSIALGRSSRQHPVFTLFPDSLKPKHTHKHTHIHIYIKHTHTHIKHTHTHTHTHTKQSRTEIHTHTHTYIYIYIYMHHPVTQAALSSHSLPPSVPIDHSWSVFSTARSVHTELIYIYRFLLVGNTGLSMCRCLWENFVYEFVLASPAVPRMSCSSYLNGFWDEKQVLIHLLLVVGI